MMHTTRSGQKIRIADMGNSHLINTIKYLQKAAERGVKTKNGGGQSENDFWYEEKTLTGEQALKHLDFDAYVLEARKRGLAY